MKTKLPYEAVESYRAHTFNTARGSYLSDQQAAIEYVNRRGFVLFWPIKNITYPSLWTAVAGDRPVADEHDDPGHITWSWKDSLLGSQSWYYAKVLRGKSTIISMETAPYFYALTENYGAPDEDYLTIYEQGRMTQEAKTVYEVILENGPIDTVSLRREARLTSKESNSRFNRALIHLQQDFKICPVGVTDAGAWHYAFAYDVVARHYPEISDRARWIGERQARRQLAQLYFLSMGAARLNDLTKIFRWNNAQAKHTVEALVESGSLISEVKFENHNGAWIVSTAFLSEYS
jgi:hypothetical protein